MNDPLRVKLLPNPTQWDFIKCDKPEKMIVSPRGEGKTDGGIMDMTFWSSLIDKQYLPLPWAIVRDTWTNLARTTLKSFTLPQPGSFASQIRQRLNIRDGGRYIELPGKWTAYLFGVDTPDDLNQLQSMQLFGLWVEEAAPAMQEEIGRGIAEEVWTIGLTSLRHQVMSKEASEYIEKMDAIGGKEHLTPAEVKEGLRMGALVRADFGYGPEILVKRRHGMITENYPAEDHWTWVRFYEEGGWDRAIFRIPRGENPHIDVVYRKTMEASLRGRPDLLDRLVIGRPAHVQMGVAVTPEYQATKNNGAWHRSDKDLDPMPNQTTYRFWDGDMHPSCVFAQWTPRGKFIVTDTVRAPLVGYGMKQLLDDLVKPLIQNRYHLITKWRDLGDPTLADRDPSDSSQTAASIIEKELNTRYEGGVLRWTPRKEALKRLLLSEISNGEPMFVVSKHERILHRSLSGGWHYHKSAGGKVSDEPDNRDINSHPAAGLSHGIAKLFQMDREARIKLPASRKKIAVASSVQSLHGR